MPQIKARVRFKWLGSIHLAQMVGDITSTSSFNELDIFLILLDFLLIILFGFFTFATILSSTSVCMLLHYGGADGWRHHLWRPLGQNSQDAHTVQSQSSKERKQSKLILTVQSRVWTNSMVCTKTKFEQLFTRLSHRQTLDKNTESNPSTLADLTTKVCKQPFVGVTEFCCQKVSLGLV